MMFSGVPRTSLLGTPLAYAGKVRLFFALALLVTVSMCVTACGHEGKSAGLSASEITGTSGGSSHDGYVQGDDDSDDLASPRKDQDDSRVRDYGQEAGIGEQQAVTTLIKRYYAAAAAGDGVAACSLIYSGIATRTDFAEVVPEAYEQVSGSSLFHDKTCAEVESILFELAHKQLVAGAPTVAVTSLRVKGARGIALLAFKHAPERQIMVEREKGRWMVNALLDDEIP